FSPEIAYTQYLAMQSSIDIHVEPYADNPVAVYRLDKTQVLEKFAQWREEGVEATKKLIDGISHLDGLEKELDAVGKDTRFERLTEIDSSDTLSGICILSRTN